MSINRKQGLESLAKLTGIIGPQQARVIRHYMMGEEGEHFAEKALELSLLVETMPRIGETDGAGDAAVVQLHYFTAGADWWITEIGQDGEAFGFVCISGMEYCSELGYISLPEVLENRAEIDLYWGCKTLGEVKAKIQRRRTA